jgi:hypothetical protein
MKTLCLCTLLLIAPALFCQSPSVAPAAPTPTIPTLTNVNREVLQLVIEDQWDRGNDMFGGRQVAKYEDLDWPHIGARDEVRHAAMRKLIAAGKLQSGDDFFFAALIFQHSAKPEELLLAHILAVTAVEKGSSSAKPLAAATMDRYLQSAQHAQIFGTQFRKGADGKWTMEPYEKATLSDAERALWCIVPLAEQEKILAESQQGKPPASTKISGCQ